MATILIDYENASISHGLDGFHYLKHTDEMILFFSKSCPTVRTEFIDHIRKVECAFDVYELQNVRKNALDFYAAVHVGRLVECGKKEIVLITNDKGFNSIIDYVNMLNADVQIVRAANIEQGLTLLSDPMDKERRIKIIHNQMPIDINSAFMAYKETHRWQQQIKDLFADDQEIEAGKVISFVEATMRVSPHNRYVQSLHTFGRTQGLAVYRALKTCLRLE